MLTTPTIGEMPYTVRYITTMKAKRAVRGAIDDFTATIRSVMKLGTFPEKVRFERQIQDLEFICDDIMRRLDKEKEKDREPRASKT